MILVDTSVWVDHLHASEPRLIEDLESGLVTQHPMIIGELSLGSILNRAEIVDLLRNLDEITPASHDEVMALVDNETLYGRGLGLVDAHLLTSLKLTPGTELWTRDERLRQASADLGLEVRDSDSSE